MDSSEPKTGCIYTKVYIKKCMHTRKTNIASAKKPSQKETHLKPSPVFFMCYVSFRGCSKS